MGEPELYPFAVLNGTQLYPRFWQIGGGGGGGDDRGFRALPDSDRAPLIATSQHLT